MKSGGRRSHPTESDWLSIYLGRNNEPTPVADMNAHGREIVGTSVFGVTSYS